MATGAPWQQQAPRASITAASERVSGLTGEDCGHDPVACCDINPHWGVIGVSLEIVAVFTYHPYSASVVTREPVRVREREARRTIWCAVAMTT